ncbi:uncharacterized protein LOC129228321 [Uloborus diversus]|uniref:uncharacterized protein LOC129228321 n=1 Tax=Uloborus diversus TaxID=327109 RepID=UPI00240A559B|nr:uncharacterized protein LOC129228321 [Uloborus diversus]
MQGINNQEFDDNGVNSQIKSTFELLERGVQEIQLSEQYKDVVLVLGNTGAGKTTFTQWIAGDNDKLIAKEVAEGTGEFIIEDNNRIGNSTIKSKTIFPELVVEPKTKTAFYDCPGFSDTRSTSNEISATYFIKKVLDHAERVKLIFIVNYSSVRKGVDRQDLMKLLRHTTDLVKDVDKFGRSIAVVVSKVDNQYVRIGTSFSFIGDSKIISAIADFLSEVKHDMEESKKVPNLSDNEQKFYSSAIKFIDILLKKEGGYHTKIGIFRRPDEPGPLSNITLLREGKEHIEKLLYERLNFTEKISEDFGYTISEKSKNDINDLIDEINKRIWSNWVVIGHQTISLDGFAGESHHSSTQQKHEYFTVQVIHGRSKGRDGACPGANGADGKPGGAGGPGGFFFGVGEHFVGGENLTVTANGGEGGLGQDGGDGFDGNSDGSKTNNIKGRTTIDIYGNLTLGQLLIYMMFGSNKSFSCHHYITPEQEQSIKVENLAAEVVPIVSRHSFGGFNGFVGNCNHAPQWYKDMHKDEFEELVIKKYQRNEKKAVSENSLEEILTGSMWIFDNETTTNYGDNKA